MQRSFRVNLAGKSFVVTGGAGFIGSHVVDQLIARGAAKVTVIDNFSTGFRELVSKAPQANLVEGDLLDQAMLARAIPGHDMVFHLAANADVKDGLLHPRKDVEQNVIATQNVLEAMRAAGVKKIAFSSTGSAYGESEVIPTPENAPFPIQTSLYGASKVAAEGLLTAYAWGYGFETWIYRFVSMLGPRYSHGHVIDFWRKLKKDPTQLEVLGDGHQRKSYLHVLDCVDAMLLTVEKAEKAATGADIRIYNIGHDEWIEVNDSIKIICRTMGLSPTLKYGGGTRGWVGDSPRILLDATKLRALGWKPRKSIEACVVETLEFLEVNPYLAERK
jgi:UDP-glucose 4-epimerase